MNDDQLAKILAESRPPEPSAALDERMMNSYRRITRNRIWFVLLHARIPVPVRSRCICGSLLGSRALEGSAAPHTSVQGRQFRSDTERVARLLPSPGDRSRKHIHQRSGMQRP